MLCGCGTGRGICGVCRGRAITLGTARGPFAALASTPGATARRGHSRPHTLYAREQGGQGVRAREAFSEVMPLCRCGAAKCPGGDRVHVPAPAPAPRRAPPDLQCH